MNSANSIESLRKIIKIDYGIELSDQEVGQFAEELISYFKTLMEVRYTHIKSGKI